MTNKFDRIHTNTNKKCIIRNCPCIVVDECNSFKDNEIFCQDCTDCVLKQIVEKCREHHTDLHFTPSEILALIDIQEVE